MTGIGFLVECMEEAEIFKKIPNSNRLEVVQFFKNGLYTAITDTTKVEVIDRNHKNCSFPLDLFDKHFKIKLNR